MKIRKRLKPHRISNAEFLSRFLMIRRSAIKMSRKTERLIRQYGGKAAFEKRIRERGEEAIWGLDDDELNYEIANIHLTQGN